VSYEDGGRTLLLLFQPAGGGTPDLPPAPATDPALERVLDPEWIRAHLSAALPGTREGRGRVVSCRAGPAPGGAGDAREIRYVIRTAGAGCDGTRILTARLHPTEAAAQADRAAALRLHAGLGSHRLRIPRPIARLAAEPRLVVYQFDPWMNLREYLAHRGSLGALHRSAERIAKGLASLHGSRIPLGDGTTRSPEERLAAGGAPVALLRRRRVPVDRRPVPIHGALRWDSILLGVDRRFYLYRFEACGLSDSRFDLGGFAADLLCFTERHHDAGAYGACLDLFLARYAAEGGAPVERDELRPYIALALLDRLEQAGRAGGPEADRLSGALEALREIESEAGNP
jgi:hypothetical protein